jgi:hypothetical protein
MQNPSFSLCPSVAVIPAWQGEFRIPNFEYRICAGACPRCLAGFPPEPVIFRGHCPGSVLNSGARLYEPQQIPMQSKPLRVADPRSENKLRRHHCPFSFDRAMKFDYHCCNAGLVARLSRRSYGAKADGRASGFFFTLRRLLIR